MTPAAQVERVVLELGDKPRHRALDGVSLDVAVGEKVVLVGRSGSGKSSLLRCINGLEKPQAGAVRVFGENVVADCKALRRARRRTGTIFQSFNLFAMRTVLDNVALGLVELRDLPWREARERARLALAEVGVGGFADRFPFQLSGGQQQRVAVARAMAVEPELLLLDEPTSALDPELVGGMLALLEHVVVNGGLTVVCVTHEMAFARRLADRVVVLDQGRVLADGPPNVVLGERMGVARGLAAAL